MHRNDEMLDLCRTVTKLATDMTSTLIVDAERMCRLQAQFVRDACQEQAKAAELLKNASPQDMLGIQMALVGAQMKNAISCWNDFYASAGANPMGTFGPAQMRTMLAFWSAYGGFRYPASSMTDSEAP